MTYSDAATGGPIEYTPAWFLFNDDDERAAGPFWSFEAAIAAMQTALNGGDFEEEDGYYVGAGSVDEDNV